MDIEELASLGTKVGECPYYGSREAIPSAEVIALPYSMLLHPGTRQVLNLQLKDCVIVFDEGHNLVNAISNVHSSIVSLRQVRACMPSTPTQVVTRQPTTTNRKKPHIPGFVYDVGLSLGGQRSCTAYCLSIKISNKTAWSQSFPL